MVYTYYSVLYGGFENEKKKGQKFLTSRALGIWTMDSWIIFTPLILIFTEGESDQIKYRQPSYVTSGAPHIDRFGPKMFRKSVSLHTLLLWGI